MIKIDPIHRNKCDLHRPIPVVPKKRDRHQPQLIVKWAKVKK